MFAFIAHSFLYSRLKSKCRNLTADGSDTLLGFTRGEMPNIGDGCSISQTKQPNLLGLSGLHGIGLQDTRAARSYSYCGAICVDD